jgi:hypothetical protein
MDVKNVDETLQCVRVEIYADSRVKTIGILALTVEICLTRPNATGPGPL